MSFQLKNKKINNIEVNDAFIHYITARLNEKLILCLDNSEIIKDLYNTVGQREIKKVLRKYVEKFIDEYDEKSDKYIDYDDIEDIPF